MPLVVAAGLGRRRDAQLGEHRHVAAALQRAVSQADLVEHALDLGHVPGPAAVAGAQHCQLFAAEAEQPGATALHERQGLQRLQRGPGERQPVRIADLRHDPAVGVGDSHGAEVHALERAAAVGFDQRNQGSHASMVAAAACGHETDSSGGVRWKQKCRQLCGSVKIHNWKASQRTSPSPNFRTTPGCRAS